MPSRADQQLWNALWPIERDEIVADLLAQVAARQGTPPLQLLQQLAAPATPPPAVPAPKAVWGGPAQVAADLTPRVAGPAAQLHQRVATAVTTFQRQAAQEARARRRRALRRLLGRLLPTAALALAALLVTLAFFAQRAAGRAADAADYALAQLAEAQQQLDDAKTRRAARYTDLQQTEALAGAGGPTLTNNVAASATTLPAAGPALSNAPPTATSAPGNAPASPLALIRGLQQQVRERTEERDRLRARHAELEPQILQSAQAELADVRQALASLRQSWQELEANARSLSTSPSLGPGATSPLQPVLRDIASWQTQLAEHDHLLGEIMIAPATLAEAERLLRASWELEAVGRAQSTSTREAVADWRQRTQDMEKRLRDLRQTLAEARQSWQQLETNAGVLSASRSPASRAPHPLQPVLQAIASWQTRLAEQDRLLGQITVTPATLIEVDRLMGEAERATAEAQSKAENTGRTLAEWRERTVDMEKRLRDLRQTLAEARQEWENLDTQAKVPSKPAGRNSRTPNPQAPALPAIASWQTRLEEQDRLLGQITVTPATFIEAERFAAAVDQALAESGTAIEKVRGAFASRSLLAAMQVAFTLASAAKDVFGNPVVTREGRGTEAASGLPLEVVHSASGLVLVLVPAGEFQMGSPSGEAGRYGAEGPVHPVRLTQPFYVGKYEVTQEQWQKVLGANPSDFTRNRRRPVETVSWYDAQRLVAKLNEGLDAEAGVRFGLPSEAQWEYACRAGSPGRFGFGDEEARLGDHAWYSGNAGGSTHPVGERQPNRWGVYDMHGNVWEWCEDVWHDDYEGAPSDGRAWSEGGDSTRRALRGGSWNDDSKSARAAYRVRSLPDVRDPSAGVRVVLGLGARTR